MMNFFKKIFFKAPKEKKPVDPSAKNMLHISKTVGQDFQNAQYQIDLMGQRESLLERIKEAAAKGQVEVWPHSLYPDNQKYFESLGYKVEYRNLCHIISWGEK